MSTIKKLVSALPTEGELQILHLVDSGMSYNDLGRRLLTNDNDIKRTYIRAREKMDKLSTYFSTPVEKQ